MIEIFEALNKTEESSKYDAYLKEHISNVKLGYKWIKENLPDLLNGATPNLKSEIDNHDKSKYSEEEYKAYDDYFYGDTKSKEVDYNFDLAWNHHQKNNPHHWQYWVLLKDEGETVPLDMDYDSILHMICDWWSFSWKSGNLYGIFDWYKKNKEKQIMSKKTRKVVEEVLDTIKKKLDDLK